MTRQPWLLGVVLGLFQGCARQDAPPSESDRGAPERSVRWFGALHEIMAEGKLDARVRIADAAAARHTFGVGALSGLRGEVTILDGVAWIAQSRGDGTVSVSDVLARDTDESAALLVVGDVPSWRDVTVHEDVPFERLDAYLAQQLEAQGFSLRSPVPMLVTGPLADVRWHVVDGSKLGAGADHSAHLRSGATGVIAAGSPGVTLVGFFSREHAGVFTHMGSSSHLHVVAAAPAISAHVDGVVLLEGARLRLPSK